MRALVMLNPAAHRGDARRRLELVRSRLPRDAEEVETTGTIAGDMAIIRARLAAGTRLFIAAGGDGTVHSVVNALWQIGGGRSNDEVVVGAVGLGSSNDVHKPTSDELPCFVDFGNPRKRDVVQVSYGGSDEGERVFLASASLGVTAEANALFNREDRVLRHLKRRSTGLAIPYAALRTIAAFDAYPADLTVDREESSVQLSNLSILKTPFVSGALSFDVTVDPADGHFAVTLCDGMSRWELARTLVGLYGGHFTGRPKTRAWIAQAVQVRLETSAALELDGEIVQVTAAEFQIHPGWLTVCGI